MSGNLHVYRTSECYIYTLVHAYLTCRSSTTDKLEMIQNEAYAQPPKTATINTSMNDAYGAFTIELKDNEAYSSVR